MNSLDLRKLFEGSNEICKNCTILHKPLSRHTILEEYAEPVDVLFVSDFPKPHQGDFVPFRPQEFKAIQDLLLKLDIRKHGFKVGYTTAIKCPIAKSDEASVKDIKVCRSHIDSDLLRFKPKLVFACGKLPTTMMFGKNRSEKEVRGKGVKMEVQGHEFYMVPIIHPWQVVIEPVNSYLFTTDVTNYINEIILGKKQQTNFDFKIIDSFEALKECEPRFVDTDLDISVDIETTGLNFLIDKINTISLTRIGPNGEPEETIAIPIDHKAANINLKLKAAFLDFICKMMRNTRNKKILQNSQFDLKFLRLYGVTEVENIWDTKLIQHLYNEDIPKSLQDLIYYYFPSELNSI